VGVLDDSSIKCRCKNGGGQVQGGGGFVLDERKNR